MTRAQAPSRAPTTDDSDETGSWGTSYEMVLIRTPHGT